MSRPTETIIDLPMKDDFDAVINDAIRVSGDDPRVAIDALIADQRSLMEAYAQRILAGYVRRGA